MLDKFDVYSRRAETGAGDGHQVREFTRFQGRSVQGLLGRASCQRTSLLDIMPHALGGGWAPVAVNGSREEDRIGNTGAAQQVLHELAVEGQVPVGDRRLPVDVVGPVCLFAVEVADGLGDTYRFFARGW